MDIATSPPDPFVGAVERLGAVELLGRSPAILRLQELIRRAASAGGPTLLVADTGIDVESVAYALHQRSHDDHAPLVTIDCSQSGTVERALFGPVRDAGARELEAVALDSRIAAARGGSLYLHGVTELPAAVQLRLARLARDGEMRLDGQSAPLAVRLIASAQPTIDEDVHEHRFRPDLYRRLAAARIDLPPLRDRAADVPALAERLLLDVCVALGAPPRAFTQSALALLSALNWPGNLAELRTVVERIVAESPVQVIQIEQVVPALHLNRGAAPFVPSGKLRDARLRFERDYIAAVLQHHGWRMADAAQTLGIQRPNLYRKARQLGIPVTRLTD